MSSHIIVVEDEADLADLVALHLQRENYRVTVCADGEEGWATIRREVPDLAILDLMLPGLDGYEICRRIRKDDQLTKVRILMLTARGEEADVVTGLELGADDYVTKPFSPRVLVARARSVLRRGPIPQEEEQEVLEHGPVRIDLSRHEVRVADELITLTRTEFEMLHCLLSRPGRVRTRSEILERIGEGFVLERTVDVHISSLRKKLGEAGPMLETVRGVGYRFRD